MNYVNYLLQGTLNYCPEQLVHKICKILIYFMKIPFMFVLDLKPFTAEQAFDIGLVNKVLPPEELMPYAYAQAAKLAALPPSSLRITKQLMKFRDQEAVVSQIQEEGKYFSAMLKAPAAKEAFAAFFERRKPDYSKIFD